MGLALYGPAGRVMDTGIASISARVASFSVASSAIRGAEDDTCCEVEAVAAGAAAL